MSLNKHIIQAVIWFRKVGVRFFKMTPFYFLIIVILTLCSQLFLLLYHILPLKVILLLSSDSIPAFFPSFLQQLEKKTLIIYLAFSIVGFLILHLISERLIDKYTKAGSNLILVINKKMVLYEDQDHYAENTYKQYIKSLSNIIFFVLALSFIGYIYQALVVVILLYMLIAYLMFVFLYQFSLSFQNKLNNQLNDVLTTTSNLGFLVVFIFIVTSLIIDKHTHGFILDMHTPGIFLVVVSLLIMRQMMGKFKAALSIIATLYKKRLKINSLFFYRHTKTQVDHTVADPFWSLLEKDQRHKWMQQVIAEIMGESVAYQDSSWLLLNLKNIVAFKVNLICNDTGQIKTVLLKIFNKNITSQAIHEASLMAEHNSEFLSLRFLGSSMMNEFHCNLYDYSNTSTLEPSLFKAKNIEIRLQLMSVRPVEEILKRYSRSHPFLWQRLDKQMFKKLYVVTNDDEQLALIKSFDESFDKIIAVLRNLPVQYINPLITKDSIVVTNESLRLLHWGGWKIDSIGTGYPVNAQGLNYLKDNLELFKKLSDDRASVEIDDIVLVALLTQFEALYLRENFAAIFNLIPRILESMSITNCVE